MPHNEARVELLSMRVSANEKKAIGKIAKYHGLSVAGAMRMLIAREVRVIDLGGRLDLRPEKRATR